MSGTGSGRQPMERAPAATSSGGIAGNASTRPGTSAFLQVQRDFAVGVLGCNDMSRCMGLMLEGVLRLLDSGTGAAFSPDPDLDLMHNVAAVGMNPELEVAFHRLVSGRCLRGSRSGRRIRYLAAADRVHGDAASLAFAMVDGVALIRISMGKNPPGWLVVALPAPVRPPSAVMRGVSRFVSYANRLLESVHSRQIRLDAALELQLAAEGTGVATWEIDLTERRVIFSNRAAEIHAVRSGDPQPVKEAFTAVFPPDRRGVLAAIFKAIRTKGIVSHEFRSADGKRWIGVDARVYAAPEAIMLGISRDISGHKQRQEELAGAGIRLREMVAARTRELDAANSRMDSELSAIKMAMEGSGAGGWHLDIPTGRVQLDSACCDIYGLPGDGEMNLELMIERVHPVSRGILLSRLSETLMPHGESDWDHEFLVDHPDRGQRWISGRGRVFRDLQGRAVEMAGINIDITELKEAEVILRGWNAELERQVETHTRELSESEDRFKLLANAIADGVVVSVGGVIVDVNTQIAEMFGYTPDEVRGRPVLDFVAPESVHDVTASLLANRDDMFEWTGLRRDGSRIPVESRARIRDWGGRTVRIGVVRDLSEPKRIEAELAALRRELDQSRKLALMGEVSAGIVHQISQPLSAAGGNLAALRSLVGTCAVSCCDVAEVIDGVAASVARMRDIITHIRKVAGPRIPVLLPVQVNPVVLDMLPLLRVEADARQLAVTLKLGHDLPDILADVSHLSQLLVHLVRGAIEEACQASVPGWIEVETRLAGDHWLMLGVRFPRGGPDTDRGPADPAETPEPTRLWMSELPIRFCRVVAHSHHGRFEEISSPAGREGGYRVFFPVPAASHTKV